MPARSSRKSRISAAAGSSQVSFLFEGRIRLRANDDDPGTEYDLAIVPSRLSHAMNGLKAHYGATLFIEPETREGRVLAERYLHDRIVDVDRAPVGSVLTEIRAAALEQRGRSAIVDLARCVVHSLTDHSEPAVASDERILRAVKYVNDHLSAPITLKQVAGIACLSPSRFRHLFAEQTGMGLCLRSTMPLRWCMRVRETAVIRTERWPPPGLPQAGVAAPRAGPEKHA